MEETINIPTNSYRADEDPMYTETASWNKKRKFPAEHLGLPSPKHKSLQGNYLESGSITNAKCKEFDPSFEAESCRRLSDDISQSGSARDVSSFSGVNATTISISSQLRDDIWYAKASSSDQQSTSSINFASTSSTKSLYSLGSRSMEKPSSSSDETNSSYNIGEEIDLDHGNFGSHSCPYYDDDNEIELISHADYTCSELGHDNMEQCTGDEDPGNYVLSSGSWSVNQENEQGAKKKTIDKEFEEYFSSLML